MSFQIIEILDSQPEGTWVKIGHENNQVTALVVKKRLDETLIGKSLEAEIGYDQVLRWEVIADFKDANSGIWQGAQCARLWRWKNNHRRIYAKRS